MKKELTLYGILYNNTSYFRICLVLAYDLLEDRRTIDVIITKFFSLRFKMAESFENLYDILRDWAVDKVQKSLTEALNRFEKQEKER